MNGRNRATGAILLALFLSGFAGLVHEISWARLLEGLIGSTAHAHAAVLTVFMGGLALGGVLFGRRSDRRLHPLRTYVVLELAIAAYSVLLPWIVAAAGALYEALAAHAFEQVRLKFALRFALALLSILLPAVWMGGTLPLLARHLIADLRATRRHVAGLYSVNNLGAVLGTGLAGFVLLPGLGVHASLVAASLFNLAAAALVWRVRRVEGDAPGAAPGAAQEELRPQAGAPAEEGRYGPLQHGAALFALFASGFAAMGYEVVFLRLIALAFGSSTYSFTVMLMAFITGIGIGSAVVARARVRRPLWWLAASQLGVVVSLVAVTPLLARLPYLIGLLRVDLQYASGGFGLFLAGKALLCLAVLLLPTVCIGVGFPLVAHVQARSLVRVGSAVGSTYAWNTVGNVLGVLVTALVFLPGLGVLGAFHANLALNLLGGLAVLAVAGETRRLARAGAASAAGIAALLYAALGTGWIRPVNHAVGHLRLREGPDPLWSAERRASHPTASFAAWRKKYEVDPARMEIFFLREDANLTVLVTRPPGDQTTLYVNSKPDASTQADLPTQLLLAHAPLFLAPRARSLLVIGHGSGITAGAALLHPLERADIVEISTGVLEADPIFAEANHGVLSDPRVHVYQDDGRTFLRTVPRTYDVIVSQPSNPWVAGVAALFTREFFEECRARLVPGGIFCLWFHEYEQSDEAVRLTLRTLRSVFPEVWLFQTFFGDTYALASSAPFAPDFAAMEERFDAPSIRADLARIDLLDLGSLLAHHVVPPGRVAGLLGAGPLNTDDHQRLEFLAPRAFFTGETSELVWRANGWRVGGDGAGTLLERYVAWRAERGEPYTRTEADLESYYLVRRLRLSEDQRAPRVQEAFRARLLALAPSREILPTRPARGAMAPAQELSFAEARAWGEAMRAFEGLAQADGLFRRALELQPDDLASRVYLARVLRDTDRLPEAIDVLEAGLRPGREAPALLLELGRFQLLSGDPGGARAVLERALAADPSPEVWTVLGNVHAALGDPTAAAASYERALVLDPSHSPAALGLGRILASRPEGRRRALQVVERALLQAPRNQQLLELRAQLAN